MNRPLPLPLPGGAPPTAPRLAALLAAACAASLAGAAPALAAPDEAPGRFALLVGIDQYGQSRGVPADQQWSRLYGPVHDTLALRSVLASRGFDVDRVVDRGATRQGIVEAFERQLIDKVRPGRGDIAVFAFAGHGQQIPDDEARRDEADGYDEALVPFDNKGMYAEDEGSYLRDDVLQDLIKRLRAKGAHVVVLLDTCHSGTATRAPLRPRGSKPVRPPSTSPLPAKEGQDGAGGLFEAGEDLAGDVVVLSAARAEEPAYEVQDPLSGASVGAFSHALVRTLEAMGPKDMLTYDQLVAAVTAQLPALGTPQRPVLEGAGGKVVFSGQWGAPPRYFPAPGVDEKGRLIVEAGQLHGVGLGTELALFPPEAAAQASPEPVGKARVIKVLPARSLARVEGAIDGAKLARGAVARVERLVHEPAVVRVWLDGLPAALEADLKTRLGAVPFATLVDGSKATGDERPYDRRVGFPAAGGKPDRTRLVVEDARGEPLRIPMGCCVEPDRSLPADHPEAGMRLAQALQKDASFTRLVALENRLADTALKVELVPRVRPARAEDSEPTSCDPAAAKALDKAEPGRLRLGDHLYFELVSHEDVPVYASLVELLPDGRIRLMELEDYAKVATLAPRERRVLRGTCFAMSRPLGRTAYKLIASDKRVELAGLEESTRSAKSALEQMVGDLKAPTTRSASDDLSLAWGTDTWLVEVADGPGWQGGDASCDRSACQAASP